jgi:putative ABC transport system permease protein
MAEYYKLSWPANQFLRGVAAFVGVLMGIGAIFAAMNTMYAIVANRSREVGNFALGIAQRRIDDVRAGRIAPRFRRRRFGMPAAFLINGINGSTTASMGEISFAFRVTPADLGYGLLFASTMGVIGSLLPAARAARLPIISALRQG